MPDAARPHPRSHARPHGAGRRARHEHAGGRRGLRAQRGDAVPLLPVQARPAPGRDRAPAGRRPAAVAVPRGPRRAASRTGSRALLDHLFVGMTADEDLWRALHRRGDPRRRRRVRSRCSRPPTRSSTRSADWLRDLCPDAPALHEPAVVRRDPQRRRSASWSSTCRNPRAAGPPSRAGRASSRTFSPGLLPISRPIRCR